MNSKQISFFIPGVPVPKGRPRLSRHGVYTPRKTKNWESYVYMVAKQHKPKELITSSIYIKLDFYMPWPKSKKFKVIKHVSRPDLDNLEKAVLDALEGVMFKNDSQIWMKDSTKRYAETLDKCGVDIWIFWSSDNV